MYDEDVLTEDTWYEDTTYDTLPTGILGLDILLGGGYLRGKLIEVLGKQGSGKSTLAYALTAETQRRDAAVAWIEAGAPEFAEHYARAAGIDLSKLSVITPNQPIETVLQLTADLIACGSFAVVILDDLQRSFRDGTGKPYQRLQKLELRELAAAAMQTKTTLLFTTTIEQEWLMAHPFWVTQRFQTLSTSSSALDVVVLRSPTGTPQSRITLPLVPEQGINHTAHLITLAVQRGIMRGDHGYYTYQGAHFAHGIAAASAKLDADPALKCTITAAIIQQSLPVDYAWMGCA